MDNLSHGIIRAPTSALDRQPQDRRGVGRILLHIITHAEAHSLPPPEVPPDLIRMPTALRVYESLRLAALQAEYALSPHGHVRALANLICRIAVVIGMVLIAAAGILALASLVLGVAVVVAGQLVTFLVLLLKAVLLLLALLAIGLGLLFVVGMVTRR